MKKIITLAIGLSLFGKSIIDYEKEKLSNIPSFLKLENVKLISSTNINKNWKGVILDIELTDLRINKKVHIKDTLFTNGKFVTTELYDINSHQNFKDLLIPNMPSSYYDKKHLIAGDINAKHKVVLFSDPLCPFCIEHAPEVIKAIKNSPDIALFYYHFPLLSLHPASDTITKYMIVAHKKGIKDLVLRVYEAKLDEKIDSNEQNNKKILDVLNNIFNTSITLNDIKQPWVRDELLDDIKKGDDLLVRGTPTIFVDGKYDKTREKLKQILKGK